MDQKKIKQLKRLLLEWAEFVNSGRHEAPSVATDREAKDKSEPMAAEMTELERLKNAAIRCERSGDVGLADMYWLDYKTAISRLADSARMARLLATQVGRWEV